MKSSSDGRDGEDYTNNNIDQSLPLPLEKLNLGSHKKLLVFGLDGVLIYRVSSTDIVNIPKYRPHEDYYAGQCVFRRPYFKEFMKFCFERFEVGIWSSFKEVKIDAVAKMILKDFRTKPLFAWDQKHCIDSGFTIDENNKKTPIVFKELKKLWEDNSFNLPWNKGEFSLENTLLIDAEPHTALLNPPNTAIFPKLYKGNDIDDNDLAWNGELRRFMQGLVSANDVPTYVKDHPIGQPAMTPSHPDWSDYSEVIQEIQVGSTAEHMN